MMVPVGHGSLGFSEEAEEAQARPEIKEDIPRLTIKLFYIINHN